LLSSLTASTQHVWSLQACIDHALSHNLQLKNRQYDQFSKVEDERQSVRAMLPSIDASSSYVVLFGRSIDPNTNEIVRSDFFSNTYSLNAELNLFQGFQKQHQRASAKLSRQAAIAEFEHEKYLLAFRIMTAYYDVLYFEDAILNATAQLEIANTNKALVTKQIEVGLKAGSEIHLAESVVITDELQLTKIKNQQAAATLRLLQEINLDVNPGTFTISPVDSFHVQTRGTGLNVDSLYLAAASFLPIMQASEFKVIAAQKQVKQARGMLAPSLDAFAGYGTGFFETNVDANQELIPYNQQLRDNASQYVGLSLSIPISDRGQRRTLINQRKIDLLRMSNDQLIQQQEVRRTIQELVANFKATSLEHKKSIENEAALKTTYDIATKKFENGLFSALELYRVKNLYATAQNQQLQLKMKLHVIKQTIDFYAGESALNITRNTH